MIDLPVWGVILPGAVVCLALLIHSLVLAGAGVRRPVSVTRTSLFLRCAVEWLALYLWLSLVLPLLAWMLVLGDADHWFYRFAWVFAAVIATLSVARTARRFRNRTATLRFARIHFWIPLVLLAMLAIGGVVDFVQPIKGSTAEAAAARVLARMTPHIDEPVHLIETTADHPLDFVDSDRCRRFWIMGVGEQRGRLAVCEYRRFWWRYASSAHFPPSRQKLDQARKWLGDGRSSAGAAVILSDVVQNYPGTPAEDEARKLLESLGAGLDDEPETQDQ